MIYGVSTQAQRRAIAQEKLLAATVELIAELGPAGFSLDDVGARAGVSRGLPAYHFASRSQLLAAVAKHLVAPPPASADTGLPGLLQWIEAELDKAAGVEPHSWALLRLIVMPDVESLSEERKAYWDSRVSFIENCLRVGMAVLQVRADIDLEAMAPVLLAQLHGELIRIAWGPGGKLRAFPDSVRQALTAEVKKPTQVRKPALEPAKPNSLLL